MLAESHLRQQRSSTSFDIFYEKVLAESKPITSKPILPRKRNPPRQTSNEADCYHHDTSQSYYRQKYYEVLDVVSHELSRRFDQKDFALVADMETLLLAAANGHQCSTIPESIKCMYKADLNFPRLLTHL